jgi:amino acid transporter
MSNRLDPPRPVHSFPALTLLSLLSLLCSGCSAMESDQWTMVWLLIPLLGFGLAGSYLVFNRRKAQISAWDLRTSPQVPSAKSIVLWTVAIAAAVSVSFGTYNFLLEMDAWQKVMNVGGWTLGAIVGTTLAIYLGLRFAEPRSLPGRR